MSESVCVRVSGVWSVGSFLYVLCMYKSWRFIFARRYIQGTLLGKDVKRGPPKETQSRAKAVLSTAACKAECRP